MFIHRLIEKLFSLLLKSQIINEKKVMYYPTTEKCAPITILGYVISDF